MRANVRARMAREDGAVDTNQVVGMLLVVVVAAIIIPIAAAQLNTAKANSSVTALGIDPFMVVIAIVFIAGLLFALSKVAHDH